MPQPPHDTEHIEPAVAAQAATQAIQALTAHIAGALVRQIAGRCGQWQAELVEPDAFPAAYFDPRMNALRACGDPEASQLDRERGNGLAILPFGGNDSADAGQPVGEAAAQLFREAPAGAVMAQAIARFNALPEAERERWLSAAQTRWAICPANSSKRLRPDSLNWTLYQKGTHHHGRPVQGSRHPLLPARRQPLQKGHAGRRGPAFMSSKWYARIPGQRRPVPLSANKEAARIMLGKRLKKAAPIDASVADTRAPRHRPNRGMTGTDRFHLNAMACGTGVRAAGLASLTPREFRLRHG